MSITFTPQGAERPAPTFEVSCWDCGRVIGRNMAYHDAIELRNMAWCYCADGAQVGFDLEDWGEVPTLNVANLSAQMILERLGIEFDYCGSIDSEDLLGRCMVANVGRDDSGVDPVTDGNVTFCGVREGYYDDCMARLIEVALYAREHGLKVQWA